MREMLRYRPALIFGFAIVAQPSFAVEDTSTANGITLENGLTIFPTLYSNTGYETNVALTADDEISSGFLQLQPAVKLVADPGQIVHEVTFQSDMKKYFSSSPDDYEDFAFRYGGEWQPTSRNRTNWAVSYTNSHQKRGTELTRYELERFNEVLEFDEKELTGGYEYGSKVAQAQIGASLSYLETDYSNYREFTHQFDRRMWTGDSWFNYRVGDVTSMTVNLEYMTVDYDAVDSAVNIRNADVTTLLFGAIWEGLAKTTGEFKIGVERRDFESNERESANNLALEGAITWMPRTYSEVTLELSRKSNEGVGPSDLILTTIATLTWKHDWSVNTSTSVLFNYTNREDQGNSTRQDDRQYLILSIGRRISKHFLLQLSASTLVNLSNSSVFEYDNQILTIGLNAAL